MATVKNADVAVELREVSLKDILADMKDSENSEEKTDHDRNDIIKIRLMTWNVGNMRPDFSELKYTLSNEELVDTDLIVIGTQENHFKGDSCTPRKSSIVSESDAGPALSMDGAGSTPTKSAGKGTRNSSPSVSEEVYKEEDFTWLTNMWEVGITDHLGPSWIVVDHSNLGQMKLMILARQDSGRNNTCKGLVKAKSACGIGGVVPNKGGILTGLHIRDTYIGFMSAHLAAHMEHWSTRDSNFREILRETSHAGDGDLDATAEFDHLFWIGDLNYRVDRNFELPKSEHKSKEENWNTVKSLIEAEDWQGILKDDQLHKSRRAGSAWVGFMEENICFAPTFKVERSPGPGQYKKKRVPAYCDRILFKSAWHTRFNVACNMYRGCPQVSTSDHKPVIADMEVKISTPPAAVYSMQTGGKMIKSQSYNAAVKSSTENEYQLEKRGKVWPVVSFSGLRAENIIASDYNGTSDPYLIFKTNPHDLLWRHPRKTSSHGQRAPIQTSVKRNTLNPSWDDDEVPMLHPQVTEAKELDNCSLIILVADSDLISADDMLGHVSLPFPTAKYCKDRGNEFCYDFDEPIIFEGATSKGGRLKGKIKVSWTDEMRQTALEWYESEYSDTCSCCKISCSLM